MKKVKIFTYILLLLLTSFMAFAEPDKTKTTSELNLTVSVDIYCEEDSLKTEVLSYIKRELRTLGNVTCVNNGEEPSQTLNILVIDSSVCVLSYSFLDNYYEPENFDGMFGFLAKQINSADDENFEILKELFKFIQVRKQFKKFLGGGCKTFLKSELKQNCQSVVATYDEDILEPIRKTHREIKKYKEEEKKQGENNSKKD